MNKYQIIYLTGLLTVALSSISSTYAESQLLENVKNNPEEAIALCNRFEDLNSKGLSSGSKEVIEEISREKQMSAQDAEILSIYIVGMYCPSIK